jgi:dTDP-4-dehydrorhamnose reductase
VDGHYKPDDPLKPINWYGKLKAFSEVILRMAPNVAVCRTALVIGHMNNTYRHLLSKELQNEVLVNQTLLPQYIYHRLKQGMTVRLPETIISNATPVDLLCEMVTRIIEADAIGIFHTTGPDALSRYETAKLIADTFGLDKTLISKDDSNISPLRPRNISMDVHETFEKLGIDIEKWRLKKYLADRSLYEL